MSISLKLSLLSCGVQYFVFLCCGVSIYLEFSNQIIAQIQEAKKGCAHKVHGNMPQVQEAEGKPLSLGLCTSDKTIYFADTGNWMQTKLFLRWWRMAYAKSHIMQELDCLRYDLMHGIRINSWKWTYYNFCMECCKCWEVTPYDRSFLLLFTIPLMSLSSLSWLETVIWFDVPLDVLVMCHKLWCSLEPELWLPRM